jgi:hypothetical protein
MEKIDYDGFSAVHPVANGPRDDPGAITSETKSNPLAAVVKARLS